MQKQVYLLALIAGETLMFHWVKDIAFDSNFFHIQRLNKPNYVFPGRKFSFNFLKD